MVDGGLKTRVQIESMEVKEVFKFMQLEPLPPACKDFISLHRLNHHTSSFHLLFLTSSRSSVAIDVGPPNAIKPRSY